MARTTSKPNSTKRRCDLCGKTKNLIKTDCCNNWICDDEHKYVVFFFAGKRWQLESVRILRQIDTTGRVQAMRWSNELELESYPERPGDIRA
jgi:hypothetical protein